MREELKKLLIEKRKLQKLSKDVEIEIDEINKRLKYLKSKRNKILMDIYRKEDEIQKAMNNGRVYTPGFYATKGMI